MNKVHMSLDSCSNEAKVYRWILFFNYNIKKLLETKWNYKKIMTIFKIFINYIFEKIRGAKLPLVA